MDIKINQPQDDRPAGKPLECDHCGKSIKLDEDGYPKNGVETCSYNEPYLLLCTKCYRKAGNTVR